MLTSASSIPSLTLLPSKAMTTISSSLPKYPTCSLRHSFTPLRYAIYIHHYREKVPNTPSLDSSIVRQRGREPCQHPLDSGQH